MSVFKQKYKYLLLFIVVCSLLNSTQAQQDFESILNQIVSNSNQINAAEKTIKGQIIEAKREILPENPEFEFEYLPSAADRTLSAQKMKVSQAIDFPTVYFKKKNWINTQEAMLLTEQQAYEQEVTFTVSQKLMQWVYLQKRMDLLSQRFLEIEQLLGSYEQMFETGEVNILQVNQIKIRYQGIVQDKRELGTQIQAVKKDLQAMNGGQELNIQLNAYPALSLINPDTEWNKIAQKDFRIALNSAKVNSANNFIKVQQHAYLPELKLGLGSEKTPEEHFRGVAFGMSIPLWGKANTVKQAKMEADAVKEEGVSSEQIIKAEYQKAYNHAKNAQQGKQEYESLIQGLSQKELLKIMLEQGEISLTDYLVELESYYEMQNQFILLESEFFNNLNTLNRFIY